MPIRDAREPDLPEIGALIRELADYEDLSDEVRFDLDLVRDHLFGQRPVASVTLATIPGRTSDAEEIVGFALWFPTYSTFLGRPGIWLEDLYVRPEHRGAGHGRALVHDLRARTDGRVEWSVLDWNRRAIGFYEALGAKPLSGWTTYRWSPHEND